jgi:hypothetical protein
MQDFMTFCLLLCFESSKEKLRSMGRLDQDHLHPKLEIPGLICPGQETNPGIRGGRRAL